MTSFFQHFTKTDRESFISHRHSLYDASTSQVEDTSVNFAQAIEVCESLDYLEHVKAKYIIIGIPEDIGVRVNLGRAGASEAWNEFLKAFLSLQHTSLNDCSRFCVLGNIATGDLMLPSQGLNAMVHKERKQLSDLVKLLDERVFKTVSLIIAAGKIPVIIGGGHNNCYPLLKAYGSFTPIDCINIDAHTDLRPATGRHSGNGFSHAIQEGYLKNYYMLGIQENYMSQSMIDFIKQNQHIDYSPYNLNSFQISYEVQQALSFIDQSNFCLEIDMDVVADFPSSAQSPVGYTLEKLRILIKEILFQSISSPKYFHICEAAPRYGRDHQVGKALAAIVNDLP
jgi:formiminoglutamase